MSDPDRVPKLELVKPAPDVEEPAPSAPKRETRWDGGFIRHDSKGRPDYVIRKKIGAHRYCISTRAHSLRPALEQLQRFEADPEHYNPAGGSHKAPVLLDLDLARDFLTWSRDVQHNSVTWLRDQKRYLAWWALKLKGVNLRGASLAEHIMPSLTGASARPQRTAVLKRLYSYLRKERHLLSAHEDPTYGALTVPQARPEQERRSKVIPKGDYLKVRKHLETHWRDGLDLLAGTGWHVTELVRFVQRGAGSCRAS